jgi:nudix-type nucleoside diphosphatase (YffH/AdpP family)
MKFFVVEPRVARALLPSADWQAARLFECGQDAFGAVTALGSGVDGVTAETEDRTAINAYFDLFSGDWIEFLIHETPVMAFVSDKVEASFTEHNRQVEALVARDVVRLSAEPTGVNVPINRAGLVMRARSHVRAIRDATPVELRAGLAATDVEVVTRNLPYAKYFDVEDVTLRHKRFDGTQSDAMARSVLRAADAVTVLPYDPLLDQVVLVEQFRPGAYVRGDTHPWVLEPVAGRCDGDEPVEVVAEREMVEEAGLTLLGLEAIGNYYPSPGCVSEYLYSFVGLVDLSAAQTGIHGLDTENEDIRTHFLSFDAAMGLIESGEADNGPLLLSLYWLAAHRARLREAASHA